MYEPSAVKLASTRSPRVELPNVPSRYQTIQSKDQQPKKEKFTLRRILKDLKQQT